MLKNQVLAWNRHTKVAGLNRLMGFPNPPLLTTGSPTAMHINK